MTALLALLTLVFMALFVIMDATLTPGRWLPFLCAVASAGYTIYIW